MSTPAIAGTLVQRVLPRTVTRDVLLVGTGALAVAVMAQVSLPLPFSPVPITGQTLAVMVIAAAYGATLGTATMMLYGVLGLVGLPVFADASGGIHVVTSPTFGYVVGFVVAAYVIGRLSERHWDRRPVTSLAAFGLASAIPFCTGIPWLAFTLTLGGTPTTLWQAVQLGFIPFIIPGIIKWMLAAGILPAAHRAVTALTQGRHQD
ncbi:MAG TPA: biotin transporter BioY [Pseudoclavibacter sp.]|nr:biotin transporter BioY [Pseudoclavibacter sp.]